MDEFFARNRLSAYLDGELTSAEAREVEDALARSPELRAELDELRAAIALLRAGGPVPAPKGFAARLDQRLDREPMQVGWTRHLRRVRAEAVLLAAAAALVLVFIGKRPTAEVAAPPEVAEDAVARAEAPTEVPAVTPDTLTKEPVAPTPEVANAPAVEVAGMPGVDTKADGVLGDEKLARKSGTAGAVKAPPVSKKSKPAFEKEAYVPEWEQKEATPLPTVQAPARYRLSLVSERGLFDLDAIVRGYGGQLQNERGQPIAPYPMESGESRKVRIFLPANTMTSAQLYKELQALGHAELTQADTLYSGGSAPVVIEVSRE